MLVNTKRADPLDKPVTIPPLETVATEGDKLDHAPPDTGCNVVVLPTHIEEEPVMETTGLPNTCSETGLEIHPVLFSVNVKVVVPAACPVTTPELFTVATVGLDDDQTPSAVGVSVVVALIQMDVVAILTAGFPYTVIFVVGLELHPVEVFVNTKLVAPATKPVT